MKCRWIKFMKVKFFISFLIIVIVYLLSENLRSLFTKEVFDNSFGNGRRITDRRAVNQNQENWESFDGVLKRNIFNVTGHLAPESSELKNQKDFEKGIFHQPCVFKKLPFSVVGILYSSYKEKSNVLIQKSPQDTDSQIYKEGDSLKGFEKYKILRILDGKVEFTDGSDKLCVTVLEKENISPVYKPKNSTDIVELTRTYVDKQLGSGFGRILRVVHLTPETVNGRCIGFMYSPIFRNNLFERIGLGDGDVITQINSEVLNNPTKGFEVFSAFKEESELKIIYLKHGNEKKMIKVNIK